MRCLLIGNYGIGNLGDDLLRAYFLQTFPEIEWTVLEVCTSPYPPVLPYSRASLSRVPRLPLGLRSFLFTPWWRTLGAYWRCNAVVFGGGSLFTDAESAFACILWYAHILLARIMRKPVLLAFQGIGPLRTTLGTLLTRAAVRSAAHISVRDDASAARAAAWRPRARIVRSFDPVYLRAREAARTIPVQPAPSHDGVFVIVPRHNSPHAFLDLAATRARVHTGPTRILLLRPNDQRERAAGVALAQRIPGSSIVPVRTFDDLLHALQGASRVLSQRYHASLAAFALGIPFETAPQSEGDKHDALADLAGAGPDVLNARIRAGEDDLRSVLL